MFGPETEDADVKEFTERCKDDRHHFRFIVSPEDATDMEDLKRFTRELMAVEKDLGTKLEWVAVDHWNTDPHVHVIVRGRADDGRDLVIDRDYIKSGMRDRAQDLITQELGPRTELDISRALERRQVEAERWTQLDRQLVRDANEQGVIDVAPSPDRQPDAYLTQKVGRLRHLEHLGLAESVGSGQWVIAKEAEPTLRELGQRNDIIKRMHRALDEQGIARGTADYVLAGEAHGSPIIGRLVERGLDNELVGTAYAVVDGIDGRTHHIRLPNIEAAGDSAPGSIVELRSFEDARGERRVALATRSDLSIEAQATAAARPGSIVSLSPRFGRSRWWFRAGGEAGDGRPRLASEGLARREKAHRVQPESDRTLRQRSTPSATGSRLRPAYRSRNPRTANMSLASTGSGALASGRFAMIDDGLGFKLVPWTPSIEKHIGQHISGVARADGGVDWSFGRKRDWGYDNSGAGGLAALQGGAIYDW
jgi:type IV secretory pathway VirD2 relaxase